MPTPMNKLGRFLRLFPSVSGLFSMGLGLTVLFGWFNNNLRLITVFNNYPQMGINTAITFILMGAALVLSLRNKTRYSMGLIGLSSIIVGLTAYEYLTSQSLFIDEFIYQSLNLVTSFQSGRMAPNTVVCFSAMIISHLLLLKPKPYRLTNFTVLLFSESALAIALVSLLGYFLRIEASYHWTNLAPMGIHTAVGLIVLSLGLIASTIKKDNFKSAYFVYHTEVLTCALGLFLTFSLWASLLKEEEFQVSRLNQQRMVTLKTQLAETLTNRFNALSHITNRWSYSNGTHYADWQNNARQYMTDQPDYQSIGWVDSTNHTRWIYPQKGNEALLNANLAANPTVASVLTASRNTGRGNITPIFTLADGSHGFTYYSPITNRNGKFDGFILGTCKLDKLLSVILRHNSQNHQISIFENDKLIYGIPVKNEKSSFTSESELNVLGRKWLIRVNPSTLMLKEINSPLSNTVLLIGIMLSLLASMLIQSFNKIKNQAEQLYKIESNLDSTIQYSAIGLAVASMEGRWLRVNKALVKMLGYSEEELLNLSFQAITHPDDNALDMRAIEQLLSRECEDVERIKRYQHKDGHYIWVQVNASIVRDQHENPQHYIAQVQDITERLKLEAEKNEQAMRFQAIFNQTFGYIGLLDTKGVILEINRAGLANGDLKAEDVAGKFFWDTPWWPKPEVKEQLKESIIEANTGKFTRFEASSIDPNGKELFVDVSIKPIFNDSKEVVLLLAEGRDLTENKAAEFLLRKNEEKLRAFSENAKDLAIIQLDPLGYIETWSTGAEQIKGYKSHEIIGQHFGVFYPEALQELHLPQFILDNALRSGSFEDEGWRVKKDGTLFWANIIITALFDNDKTLLGFLKITRDMTEKRVDREKLEKTYAELENAYNTLETELKERKAIEKQLVQVQKMDAIGTLTGGIAHDFNNILWMILGNTELLMTKVEGDALSQEITTDIQESALRAKALVKQLLDFSRKSESEKIVFEASSMIKETLNMLRSSIPTTIKLNLSGLEESVMIYGDTNKFNQIIVNLCTNAYHAIGNTGSIGISIEQKHITSEDIKDSIFKKPGHFLMIEVSDTGVGMSSETMEHIFEPFFTTKGVGKGTGLGLSTVHGIIEEMEGFISVYSELGLGSSFKVFLPMAEQDQNWHTKPDIEIPATPKALPLTQYRVMVVDDEEMIRKMLKRSLEMLGLSVKTYSNGREGLDAYFSNPSDFDLIITDQTMPEMVGITLARRIRKQNLKMPIILASGNASIITTEEINEVSPLKLLNKPIQISELKSIIAETLDFEARVS